MRNTFIILTLISLTFFISTRHKNHTFQSVVKNETVVLLHGLCRTSRSMAKMEKALKAEGYNIINVTYPSRSGTIDELSKDVFQALEKQMGGGSASFQTLEEQVGKPAPHAGQAFQPAHQPSKIHFVTHSMGGTLLTKQLEKCAAMQWLSKLGNIVMLAPPSRGSEVADKLLYQSMQKD